MSEKATTPDPSPASLEAARRLALTYHADHLSQCSQEARCGCGLDDMIAGIALVLEAYAQAAVEREREAIEEAAKQEVWDAVYAEEKAISKGGAPYTFAFRAACFADRVGTAIRSRGARAEERA